MLSLQEISDRMEIQMLMTAYSTAIDRRAWDQLDDVFTPDAYIDYRAMGGIDGRYPEVKAWLGPAMQGFPHYFHMVSNTAITLEGDRARTCTVCFNPMEVPLPAGGSQVMILGLWYIDELVRTDRGWRICRRVEEQAFQHNVPAHMKIS